MGIALLVSPHDRTTWKVTENLNKVCVVKFFKDWAVLYVSLKSVSLKCLLLTVIPIDTRVILQVSKGR